MFSVSSDRAHKMILTTAIFVFAPMLRAATPATQPTTASHIQTVLDSLLDQQKQVEKQKEDFENTHPGIFLGDIYQNQLNAVAQQYTTAQLESIEARSTYGEGHPKRVAAERKEADIYQAYHEILDKITKQNGVNGDYEKILDQLNNLKARILKLQEAQDLGQQ